MRKTLIVFVLLLTFWLCSCSKVMQSSEASTESSANESQSIIVSDESFSEPNSPTDIKSDDKSDNSTEKHLTDGDKAASEKNTSKEKTKAADKSSTVSSFERVNSSEKKTTTKTSKTTKSSTHTSTKTTATSITTKTTTARPKTKVTTTTTARPKTNATTKPTTTTKTTVAQDFDINYWISYAKRTAVNKGLRLESSAVDCWDNPITANPDCIYLERDINSRLNRYAKDEDITDVWIWYECVGTNSYLIYVGYA